MENVRLQLIQRFVNAHSALFFNDEAFHDETYLGQICSREITSKLTNFKEKILKYFDCEDVIKETHETKDLLEKELKKLLEENKRRKEATCPWLTVDGN